MIEERRKGRLMLQSYSKINYKPKSNRKISSIFQLDSLNRSTNPVIMNESLVHPVSSHKLVSSDEPEPVSELSQENKIQDYTPYILNSECVHGNPVGQSLPIETQYVLKDSIIVPDGGLPAIGTNIF